MINELIKLSDRLDRKGLNKESDLLDGVINKLSSGKEVSPEEAMSHETHTLSLEQPGAAGAEAQEDHEKDLVIEQVVDTLVQGSGYGWGDDEKLKQELVSVLGNYDHYHTIRAIFEKLYPPMPEDV